MKIKTSKLPCSTFLKNIKYICYTVFVTWRRIYLKISTEPNIYDPNRGYYKTCYIDPIEEIGIRQQKYPNTVTLFGTYYV